MAKQNRLTTTMAMAVAAVASLLAARAASAQEGKFTARLEAARATYPQGAPVELLLSVSNLSTGDAWIDEDYPRFAVPGHEGVTIRPMGAVRAARNAEPLGQFGGLTYRHRLTAGETSTYRIYLQRFLPDVAVGAHPCRTRWISRWTSRVAKALQPLGMARLRSAFSQETAPG